MNPWFQVIHVIHLHALKLFLVLKTLSPSVNQNNISSGHLRLSSARRRRAGQNIGRILESRHFGLRHAEILRTNGRQSHEERAGKEIRRKGGILRQSVSALG